MASNPAPRLLFCSSTLIGALSWTLTAVMVLDLKKALGGVSVTSTVEIAVFTTWATSLGTSLSLVLELVSSGAPRDAVSRLGPAASEAPSLVCLYLLYMMLQGCALLFVSATVATLDSSASMVVFTAVLVRAYVGRTIPRNGLLGLGLIAGAFVLDGVVDELVRGDGNDDGDDDDGILASASADATIGICAAVTMGAAYATTNVVYESVLTRRGTAVTPLALNGVVCGSALLILTIIVYPVLAVAGVFSSSAQWLDDVRSVPLLFPFFLVSKLAWYSLETILVKEMGAIWTAISGVALIPLVWMAELVAASADRNCFLSKSRRKCARIYPVGIHRLVAYYAFHAFWGTPWRTPTSEFQVVFFVLLALGVALYYEFLVVLHDEENEQPEEDAKSKLAPAERPLISRGEPVEQGESGRGASGYT